MYRFPYRLILSQHARTHAVILLESSIQFNLLWSRLNLNRDYLKRDRGRFAAILTQLLIAILRTFVSF